MNIEWTNCMERFPPHEQVIIRYQQGAAKLFDGTKITDSFARLFPNLLRDAVWTPFTKEKWEFLNK